MPGHLRTRLRRAFTGTNNKNAKSEVEESSFYLPGEKMPPLKYRRPVDPEHKAHLESFSFSTAWRRHSNASLYSPMGSRIPSRRNSFRSRRGRSRSRSMHRSRRSSFSSDYDAEETWVDSGIGASIAGDERPANIKEASDDEGDVLNVGLSRNPTEDPRDAQRKQAAADARRSSSTRPGTGSDRTRQPSQPFTPEELEAAFKRSSLETVEGSDESAEATPFDDFDDPSPFLRPRGGSIYVPYDGHGTPPKLPFWGTAYPSCDDAPSAGHFSRRPSVFMPCDEAFTPQYERTEPLFLPTDAPGLTSARRESVFVSAADKSSEGLLTPPPESPKRKVQPCAPCDAIAAILARPD